MRFYQIFCLFFQKHSPTIFTILKSGFVANTAINFSRTTSLPTNGRCFDRCSRSFPTLFTMTSNPAHHHFEACSIYHFDLCSTSCTSIVYILVDYFKWCQRRWQWPNKPRVVFDRQWKQKFKYKQDVRKNSCYQKTLVVTLVALTGLFGKASPSRLTIACSVLQTPMLAILTHRWSLASNFSQERSRVRPHEPPVTYMSSVFV